MTKNKKDDLDINSRDALTLIAKGATGWIPFVGPLIAEKIGIAIPGQRMDRLAQFSRKLYDRVDNLEEKLSSIENLDMLEDALIQAARSTTNERLEYIANLLKNGLNREDNSNLEKKKLLSILDNLNDIEILMLKSIWFQELLYTWDRKKDLESRMKYNSMREKSNKFDMKRGDIVDSKGDFFDIYIKTLEQNGLINIVTEGRSEGVLKDRKFTRYKVTQLGLLFLDYVEVPEE